MTQPYTIGLLLCTALLTPARSQAPEITVELPGGVPLEMVWIEPGTFLMGGEADLVRSNSYHGPQHAVTLTKGFYLGKFEVTQAQWTAAMGGKPWEEYGGIDCPNCPATDISWDDTQLFISQLDTLNDGPLRYRLPTEAEWEFAARAGTNSAWFFGDDAALLKDYAWYIENTCDVNACFIREVGLKLPNPWGLYDMYGNVSEWVEDWGERYSIGPQIDPINDVMPTFDSTDRIPERIVRGGPFSTDAVATRPSFRNAEPPTARWNIHGFRVAASMAIETQVSPTSWGALKTLDVSSYEKVDTE